IRRDNETRSVASDSEDRACSFTGFLASLPQPVFEKAFLAVVVVDLTSYVRGQFAQLDFHRTRLIVTSDRQRDLLLRTLRMDVHNEIIGQRKLREVPAI